MDRALVDTIAAALAEQTGWGQPEFIDAGNSAAVYRTELEDGTTVALKVYDPAFFLGESALVEEGRVALQMQLFQHDNDHLIQILDAQRVPDFATWFILMEYCPWPSLRKCLQDIPDDEIPTLTKQLVSAVSFLDARGLVHRDIKPDNIVVAPDFRTLKLLDLGVLRSTRPDEGNGTDDASKRRFVATAQYSPPEYLPRNEDRGPEGFRALNLYQIGGVVHDMITKRPLFDDEARSGNKYALYDAIRVKVPTISSTSVPPRLVQLCSLALEKDPRRRCASVSLDDFSRDHDTAEQMRARLKGAATKSWAPKPSYLAWEARCRSWIKAAAGSERAALGSNILKKLSSNGDVTWLLSFPVLGRSVLVSLKHQTPTGHWALEVSKTDESLRLIGEPAFVALPTEDQADHEMLQSLSGAILMLIDGCAAEPAMVAGQAE